MLRGFSKVSLQELFMLDVNSKGTKIKGALVQIG